MLGGIFPVISCSGGWQRCCWSWRALARGEALAGTPRPSPGLQPRALLGTRGRTGHNRLPRVLGSAAGARGPSPAVSHSRWRSQGRGEAAAARPLCARASLPLSCNKLLECVHSCFL